VGLKLITAPTVEPLTLDQVKAQCRIDTADEDALLALYISAARAKAENYTGAALISQTWEQTLDEFPCAEIELLKPPVTAIESVTYVSPAGSPVVLPGTEYSLDASTFPGWLLPAAGATWPTTLDCANAVTIRYTTGYANAASIPADLRAWLLLTAAYLYAQREVMVMSERVAEIPALFIDSLLDPYRVFKL
jgi:uncharacterized phiE125 gp8 family phage protein